MIGGLVTGENFPLYDGAAIVAGFSDKGIGIQMAVMDAGAIARNEDGLQSMAVFMGEAEAESLARELGAAIVLARKAKADALVALIEASKEGTAGGERGDRPGP